MFGNTVRCCTHIKHVTGAPFDISHNMKSVVATFGNQKASYAMDKKGCSKDTPQTKGRQVEDWPSHDPPPPMWRPECPRDPSPVTDPYRIKVPEIVVPQLKGGSPAQWTGVVLTTGPDGRRDPPVQSEEHQPGGYVTPPQEPQEEEKEKEEGFLGMLKNLLRGGKKDKSDQMIDTDDQLLRLQFQYLRDETQKQ